MVLRELKNSGLWISMIEQYLYGFTQPTIASQQQESGITRKHYNFVCLVFPYLLLYKAGYYDYFVFLHDLNSKTNLTVSPKFVGL